MKDLVQLYMVYLLERGFKGAAKEYMTLDCEVNGPLSVQAAMKPSQDTKEMQINKTATIQNGNQANPIAEPANQQPDNTYHKYYPQVVERPLSSNGNVWSHLWFDGNCQ